ncbi:MAG: S8 family serine peptidase [Saprospiraceae bacterium]
MLTLTLLVFGLWVISDVSSTSHRIFRILFYVVLLGLLVGIFLAPIPISQQFLHLGFSSFFLAVTGFLLTLAKGKIKFQGSLLLIICILAFFRPKSMGDSSIQNALIPNPEGEWLIQTTPENVLKISQILKDKQAVIRRAFFPKDAENTELDDYYVIDIPKGSKLSDLKTLIPADLIIWEEVNELIPMEFPQKNEAPLRGNTSIANDTWVASQWHLGHLDMKNYYEYFAANNLVPLRKAKLYILDTGIDQRHEDLPLGGTKFSADKQGHGTHCAGVAAAITNNNLGVASMSPSPDWVELHGIQVIRDIGFGSQEDIIDGIIQASDEGADVISLSLGGITNQTREKAYNDAIEYANRKGAIIVVAAGNANLDGKRYSPANSKNVITVTSVDATGKKSGFSNHVANIEMGIAAPGEKIFSTTPSNKYEALSGTSMAAPQVAGLISVMKSMRPDLDTKRAFQLLSTSGLDSDNTSRTGKIIQPSAAIKLLK